MRLLFVVFCMFVLATAMDPPHGHTGQHDEHEQQHGQQHDEHEQQHGQHHEQHGQHHEQHEQPEYPDI
jgi:hypothetical protein